MKKSILAWMCITLCACAVAQEAPSDRYLVLGTARMKTLRTELEQGLANGYAIVAGNPSAKLIILEKRTGAVQKKYRVEDSVGNLMKREDYQGYRVLPWSFSNAGDGRSWSVILESLSEGEPQPEYKFTRTAYTRNLQKDISEASAGGFRAIAMVGHQGQGAILEKIPGAVSSSATYELHATKKISTAEKEVAEAADRGFKVIAATGAGNEILILMESQPEGAQKRNYRIISTARSSTFEKEVNAAAAEGYRIVPLTGAALQKGGMFTMGTYAYEQSIIMEKVTDAVPIRYMYIGAAREQTIQKELNQSPADCPIATVFLTYQETAILLECPQQK